MARRNRISWPLAGTLAAAVCVGSLAAGYKYLADKRQEAKYGASDQYVFDVPPNVPVEIATASVKSASVKSASAKPGQLAAATTRPAGLVTPAKALQKPIDIVVPTKSRSEALVQNIPPTRGKPTTDDNVRLSPEPASAYKLTNSADLFAAADAEIKSDNLLGARKALVDALDTKNLAPADQDEAFRRLSKINETVVFSPRVFLDDDHQQQVAVKPGDSMQKIAAANGIAWQLLGKINNITDPRRLQAGKKLKVIKGPFHALVNKSAFTLDLYLGKPGDAGAIFVKRYRVGLGENDSTPSGQWAIDTKLEKPRYYNSRDTGPRVIDSGDPANPLGTRWLALTGQQGQAVGKTSYGIHGTIDPTSIGQKRSMGCIRLLNEDVEQVYDILVSGKSTVTVVE